MLASRRGRPAVFGPAKDRPILYRALAWADVLLTLDQGDFGSVMGKRFYDLEVLRPGTFLTRERVVTFRRIDFLVSPLC